MSSPLFIVWMCLEHGWALYLGSCDTRGAPGLPTTGLALSKILARITQLQLSGIPEHL